MPEYDDLVRERSERFLGLLFELIRLKSVGADPQCRDEMIRCADRLVGFLNDLLGHAEKDDSFGLPLVYGETPPTDKPTVLLYGHYDVQPAAMADGWSSEPFEPVVRDGRILGRGTADNKGPLIIYLSAIELLKSLGPLPVNFKVLVEGEEESGGDAIFRFIETNRDRLRCDLVISTDAGGFRPGQPAIACGTRGLVYKQIDITGANQDLHSGTFGGIIPDPVAVLSSILAGLVEPSGKINVPGLYDKVRPIEPDEHEQIAKLPYDTEQLCRRFGLKQLAGEKEFLPLERLGCRPHLSVNGIVGGYTGAGPKTVLPDRASAKLSVRIVPDQEPEEISELLDRRIRALADPAVKIEISTLSLADPYLGPRAGPAVDAARKACVESFGIGPAMLREGGTLPILPFFKKQLTENILVLGFTRPDCSAHGPDEYFHIDDFQRGIKTACLLYQYLGESNL